MANGPKIKILDKNPDQDNELNGSIAAPSLRQLTATNDNIINIKEQRLELGSEGLSSIHNLRQNNDPHLSESLEAHRSNLSTSANTTNTGKKNKPTIHELLMGPSLKEGGPNNKNIKQGFVGLNILEIILDGFAGILKRLEQALLGSKDKQDQLNNKVNVKVKASKKTAQNKKKSKTGFYNLDKDENEVEISTLVDQQDIQSDNKAVEINTLEVGPTQDKIKLEKAIVRERIKSSLEDEKQADGKTALPTEDKLPTEAEKKLKSIV